MSKIALIAPFPNIAELAYDVCRELDADIDIRVGDMEKGLDEAKAAINNGAQIIISRGGTAIAIKGSFNIPVIEIAVSGYDLMRAINHAKKYSNKIGVVGFKNVVYGVSTLKELMDIDIEELVVDSDKDVERIIREISSEGVNMVVGDAITVRVASRYGLLTVLVNSGKEAIVQAIREAHQAVEILEHERARTEEIKALINYAREGIIALDESGRIKLINPRAEKVLKVNAADVIGYRAQDKIPELSMEKVMETGTPVLNEINNLPSGVVVQNIVPIINNGKVVGAISTFQEASKVQKAEEKVRRQLYLKGNVAYYTFDDLYTINKSMKNLVEQAKKFAKIDSTVLINGKTGTGKEILAQSIHNASPRSGGPFVAVNCASLPETILESELFGYEEGAFTGAKKGGKIGLFEMAHKGTLFLDEIGEIPLNIQARLLRVLQERVVRRLGGDKVIPVDVRIIAATNRDLLEEIKLGNFREDLYYRLNILFLYLPGLQERADDIALLSSMLTAKIAKKIGTREIKIGPKAMEQMKKYPWPGNIRELENLIEQLTAVKGGCIITAEDLPWLITKDTGKHETAGGTKTSLVETERDTILRVLNSMGWNHRKASELLGISRSTLWRKIQKYGLNHK